MITLSYNHFPSGQCTWWANERFYQLHNVYVPWWGHAHQWVSGAKEFHWVVTQHPRKGDIVVMQPGVQGASPQYGHVAVVEQVLSAHQFLASSMNWKPYPERITTLTFTLGQGLKFVRLAN